MRQIASTSRFSLKRQLGEGSFSYVYLAFDNKLDIKCALKIEKADKPKRVLLFEYNVLKELQGLDHVCKIYDFAENEFRGTQSAIVMQLLGNNLTNHKKQTNKCLVASSAIPLLIQMLDSIEEIHSRGYIHRDVKPSNFALGIEKNISVVYIVDFGLSRQHLNHGIPIPARLNTDFRGTVTFASYNAHIKEDLSRRDDIWSFYFVVLDFLNEQLPWKACKDGKVDEVKIIKERCLKQPDKFLWKTTKEYDQIKNIFYHLQSLKYEDKPDYAYIRSELNSILERDISFNTPSRLLNSNKKIGMGKKDEIEITSKKRLNKEKKKQLKLKDKRKDVDKILCPDASSPKDLVQGNEYLQNLQKNVGNIMNIPNITNAMIDKNKSKANPYDVNINNNQPVNPNQNYINLANGIPKNFQFVPYPGLISSMGPISQINQLGPLGSLNQLNQISQMRSINQIDQINQINPSNKLNQLNEMKMSQPMMPFYPSFVFMNSVPDAINMSQNMYMPLFSYPTFSQNIININQLSSSNPFFVPTMASRPLYNQDMNCHKPIILEEPKLHPKNPPVNNELLDLMNKYNTKFLPKLNIPKDSTNQSKNVNIPNPEIQKSNYIEEKVPINQDNIPEGFVADLNNKKLKVEQN